jgi:YgiT-type zinc finger domain-containing protein
MSSFQRKSRNKTSVRGACPTCGGTKVRLVREDLTLRVGSTRHRFADIEHERCDQCGERIFDIAASRIFDAAIRSRRSRAA